MADVFCVYVSMCMRVRVCVCVDRDVFELNPRSDVYSVF